MSLYTAGTADRITSTASDDCINAFDAHFKHVSPIQKKVLQTPVGETYWRRRDCRDGEFIKSEFYQDFARKEEMYDIVYTKLCRRSGMDVGITFTRPKTNPFNPDDLKEMSLFTAHLQRAVQIYLSGSEAAAENLRLKEVISKSPRGVIFLDRACRAVYCNAVAEQIIAKKDGLDIDRSGVLFAASTQETNNLKRVLGSVFENDPHRFPMRGGFLNVSRPSGLRKYELHISPLTNKTCGHYSPERVALLFISDPEYRIETLEDVLRSMYGLTPAEGRLTALITQGISLKEAESILGVQASTVRTHMKHIFSKTNCKRQGELITMVNSGLAGLRIL